MRLIETVRAVRAVRGADSGVEIVIVAHAETDDVRRAVEGLDVVWAETPRACRGVQLRLGAKSASGSMLVFLHADTRLPPDALTALRQALSRPGVAGGGFRLRYDRAHPALDALACLSALRLPAAFFGDQALFFRRDAYETVGGFSPLPLFEDVDLVRRVARRGRLVRLPLPVQTSARRFTEHGPWRQLMLNAMLLLLYYLGVPPLALCRAYERRASNRS